MVRDIVGFLGSGRGSIGLAPSEISCWEPVRTRSELGAVRIIAHRSDGFGRGVANESSFMGPNDYIFGIKHTE